LRGEKFLSDIVINSVEDIAQMRKVGRLAREVLEMIEPYVKVGVTTEKLNQLCHDYIVNVQKAYPAPLNYRGYPKSICTSINQEVCHGIPDDKPLKSGDIVNIDVTVMKDGYYGDTSKMFCLGKTSILAQRLVKVTYECLWKGIEVVKAGNYTGDIGAAIQQHAESNLFSVVREYCGHGIGKKFHAEPSILHYGIPHTGHLLKAGMIFTIEPMINAGKPDVKTLADGWTVVTKDHSLSAQWEHTILVTETGYEVLTLRGEERK
jgi:methionyl aminopeptidase